MSNNYMGNMDYSKGHVATQIKNGKKCKVKSTDEVGIIVCYDGKFGGYLVKLKNSEQLFYPDEVEVIEK